MRFVSRRPTVPRTVMSDLERSMITDDFNFARYRANAAAILNRAVFEIPEILDSVLQRQNPTTPPLPQPGTAPS